MRNIKRIMTYKLYKKYIQENSIIVSTHLYIVSLFIQNTSLYISLYFLKYIFILKILYAINHHSLYVPEKEI